MRQIAPNPEELKDLVDHIMYKPRWVFGLADTDRGQGSEGLTLQITITTPDSYHPEQMRSVVHYMPVPPAAYDRRSWRRWLFDQILLVERHEACEFFTLHYPGRFIRKDGSLVEEIVERPYVPSHGPGNDPYIVREMGTDVDVRTSYRGELKPREFEHPVC